MVKVVSQVSAPVGAKVFGRFSLNGKVFPCVVVSHSHGKKSKKWTIKFEENFAKNYGPPPRKLQTEGIQHWKLFHTREEAEEGWSKEYEESKKTKRKVIKKPVGKSFADFKKDMEEKYKDTDISKADKESVIRCFVFLNSLNLPEDFCIEKQIANWDAEVEAKKKAEEEKRKKEAQKKYEEEMYKKKAMEEYWEKNKEKLMLQFNQSSVQEVMEKVEEEICENEDVEKVIKALDQLYQMKKKKDMLEWVKNNILEEYEDVKKMKKEEIIPYIKAKYEEE